MVNASCVLPPEYRNGDLLRYRAVKDGVIEFEIVRLVTLPSPTVESLPPEVQQGEALGRLRDIAAWLRRLSVRGYGPGVAAAGVLAPAVDKLADDLSSGFGR